MIKEMKEAFEQWIEEDNPFPELAIEWDHYDSNVRIVFFHAEGVWNLETMKILTKFLRQYDKKVLVSRLIVGKREEEKI